jgi:hypothetical protein
MANRCHNTLLARLANGYDAPTYSSVTLTSTTNPHPIKDSLFRASSNLKNLTLQTSIFNNVLLTSCAMINCIVHHSILFDCTLENTVVEHCQVIKASLALRRFAPEIRGIIFEYVIEEEGKDGKIPALVKALRGD